MLSLRQFEYYTRMMYIPPHGGRFINNSLNLLKKKKAQIVRKPRHKNKCIIHLKKPLRLVARRNPLRIHIF